MLPMCTIIPCNYVHYHRNLQIIKPKNQSDTLGTLDFLNSNENACQTKVLKLHLGHSRNWRALVGVCVACERKLILNSLCRVLKTTFCRRAHPVFLCIPSSTHCVCVKHKHFIIPHEMCGILRMRKWSVQKCALAQQTHQPILKREFRLLFCMHACVCARHDMNVDVNIAIKFISKCQQTCAPQWLRRLMCFIYISFSK